MPRASQNPRSSLGSNDRKLRYKALLDDLSSLDIDEADNNERIEKTSNAVKEAQSLLAEGGVEERVRHPGEGFLDSRVLRASSALAVRCSEAVSGNVHVYDARALAQHIKDNPDMWDFALPRAAPVISYLYGTFAPTAPEARARRAPRRAPREHLGDLEQPEDVERLDKAESNSEMVSRVKRFITKAYRNGGSKPLSFFHVVLDPTSFTKTVENIYYGLDKAESNSEMVSRVKRFITKAYRNGGSKPLSFFHVVLDPTSFTKTVENIYYVSFLARDQLLELEIEESGMPIVTPLAASAREAEERSLQEKQLMVSIDMPRWKEMVEALEIEKPMMVLKRI